MIPISFPIAYLRNSVNPPRSVSSITLLLPEDDTSDVIPRHTYLRHAQYVSVNRNFRLNPREVSGLSSLDPTIILCIPSYLCSASRAGETSARATQEHASEAAKRVSTPRPAPAPPNPYSLVSRETREDNSRPQPGERVRHAPGLTLSLRSLVSASLRRRRSRTGERTTGIVVPPSGARLLPTHVFHVKHMSTDQPSAPPPRGDCRARAVSEVCQYNPLLPPPNSK